LEKQVVFLAIVLFRGSQAEVHPDVLGVSFSDQVLSLRQHLGEGGPVIGAEQFH
jgi:hypothetical protein